MPLALFTIYNISAAEFLGFDGKVRRLDGRVDTLAVHVSCSDSPQAACDMQVANVCCNTICLRSRTCRTPDDGSIATTPVQFVTYSSWFNSMFALKLLRELFINNTESL